MGRVFTGPTGVVYRVEVSQAELDRRMADLLDASLKGYIRLRASKDNAFKMGVTNDTEAVDGLTKAVD